MTVILTLIGMTASAPLGVLLALPLSAALLVGLRHVRGLGEHAADLVASPMEKYSNDNSAA